MYYVLKCKNEKCIWKIFVKYTQIRQSNTNTNISSCGFSNTNTNTDICVFKYKYEYKYVFDPSPAPNTLKYVLEYHTNNNSQHLIGYWFGAIRHQAIIWFNVDPNLQYHKHLNFHRIGIDQSMGFPWWEAYIH